MHFKLIIIGLISMVCSSALHADYNEDYLKKLFTDKKQRAKIDAVRSGKTFGSESQQTNEIYVNGYVTRSNGKSVVWVNNKNTLDSSKIGNVNIHQSSAGKNKKVTISVDGKTVRLKPGETWLESTGKVNDN